MSEPIAFDTAGPVRKFMRRFAASGPGSWLFARVLHRIDGPICRVTRGRYTLTSLLAGLPVVMLTSIGAKSGQPRTVPLLGIPTNGTVALIASNFGQQHHPAWYYNLRAHPEAEISVGGKRRRVRAAQTEGEPREQIWHDALRMYPGYGQYERRASHRHITVFVLEPV